MTVASASAHSSAIFIVKFEWQLVSEIVDADNIRRPMLTNGIKERNKSNEYEIFFVRLAVTNGNKRAINIVSDWSLSNGIPGSSVCLLSTREREREREAVGRKSK